MAAPKKPASKKTAVKKASKPAAKAAAKRAAKPVVAKPAVKTQATQPVFTVVSDNRTANQQPEWVVNAIKYAQQNPAVTFVAIVAAALGLILLLD